MNPTTTPVRLYVDKSTIEERLRRERAKIPGSAEREVDAFLEVRNRFATRKLYAAVRAFEDPKAGFKAWRDYYSTGNDVALNAAIAVAQLRPEWVSAVASLQLAEKQALVGRANRVSRQRGPEPRIVGSRTARRLTSPIGSPHYLIHAAMQEVRRIAWPLDENVHPVYFALQNQVAQAAEKMLLESLERLRDASSKSKPLVSLDDPATNALKDFVIGVRTDRFRRIADQSFFETAESGGRRQTGFRAIQVPEGVRFGIEIEGHLPSDSDARLQLRHLHTVMTGLGLLCNSPDGVPKADKEYRNWSVVFDVSVVNPFLVTRGGNPARPYDRAGLELVSPILTGKKGASDAANLLRSLGEHFRTNETCGFHVHIDLTGAPLRKLKNLAIAFVLNESEIDEFLHVGRRGGNARYASSLANVLIEDIENAGSIIELVYVLNGGSRYSKLNLTNLANPLAPQTGEVRSEGGAGYLSSAESYMVLILCFAIEALSRPKLKVKDLVGRMTRERDALFGNGAISEPGNPEPGRYVIGF